MKFKNELYKDILRYAKDNGKYGQFIRGFELFTKQAQQCDGINIIDEHSITKRLHNLGHSPLGLLNAMGIEKGDFYYSDYLMHHHKNNMEFNKKIFEEFLDKKDIKKLFFLNVDDKFILRAISGRAIPNITETMTKEEILYNNIPPTGFVMHAFRWANSTVPSGDTYWGGINEEWRVFYIDKIKEKYNVY